MDKHIKDKTAFEDFSKAVAIFKSLLTCKDIKLSFTANRIAVSKESKTLLSEQLQEHGLERNIYNACEKQMVHILLGILNGEEKSVQRYLEEEFALTDEKDLQKRMDLVRDLLIDDNIVSEYLFEEISKSVKLLDCHIEVNHKQVDNEVFSHLKQIETAQINLALLRGYHPISDLDVLNVNFEVTKGQLDDFIECLSKARERMN